MMNRKLYGVISHVEGKKVYMGGHNDTYIKLKTLASKNPDNVTPFAYEGNKFYIISNGVDFEDMVGEKVIVWASVRKYSFKSTFSHNKGDIIKGWNLYASKVEKNGDW